MDKRKKRASVFVQLERFDSAINEMREAGIGTTRYSYAIRKYGNAYSKLVALGLAGQRAIEKNRRHGKR